MSLSELKFLEQRLSGFLSDMENEPFKSSLASLIALVQTTQKLTESLVLEHK